MATQLCTELLISKRDTQLGTYLFHTLYRGTKIHTGVNHLKTAHMLQCANLETLCSTEDSRHSQDQAVHSSWRTLDDIPGIKPAVDCEIPIGSCCIYIGIREQRECVSIWEDGWGNFWETIKEKNEKIK